MVIVVGNGHSDTSSNKIIGINCLYDLIKHSYMKYCSPTTHII